MGYATNQFENFAGYEGSNKSLKRTVDDNPNFIYPENRVPDIYNPLTRESNNRYVVDTLFQRGFIRGIYPAVLGGTSNPSAAKVKQRRLFFQFNPATIDRSVSMNTETALPLLQDPSQMFQPINGNAQFSFELLFDRQAEVVMSEYRDNDGNLVTGATLSGSLDTYGKNWQQSNVSDLGVLADLYVLDSIIGQSITPDMTSFLKEYWNYVDQVTYDGTDTAASARFDTASFEKSASINYGNSAFLSPLPIRIVFSSLFMVEGFVTASNVQFLKFTKNYVPTVCRVSLDVKALYIGFAREKSYLTDTLERAVADQVAEKDATRAVVQTATTLVKEATRFKYQINDVAKRQENLQGWYYGNDYSTFYDFFSVAGYQDNLLTFEGTVDSWVFQSLSDAVKAGSTWSLSSAFQIFEYSSTFGATDLPKENGWYGKNIYKSYITFGDLGKGSFSGVPFDIPNERIVIETNKKNDSLNPSKHVWRSIGNPSVNTIGATSIIVFKVLHSLTLTTDIQGTVTEMQPTYIEDTFKITANSASDWTSWKNKEPVWILPKIVYSGSYQ